MLVQRRKDPHFSKKQKEDEESRRNSQSNKKLRLTERSTRRPLELLAHLTPLNATATKELATIEVRQIIRWPKKT